MKSLQASASTPAADYSAVRLLLVIIIVVRASNSERKQRPRTLSPEWISAAHLFPDDNSNDNDNNNNNDGTTITTTLAMIYSSNMDFSRRRSGTIHDSGTEVCDEAVDCGKMAIA